MARPEPEIILSKDIGDGSTWQILAADSSFIILYKGQPVSIRVEQYGPMGIHYKYKKLTYTNIGNARAQVRLLNHRFQCEDFTLVEITP